jgi:hypothetical protein
MLSHRRSTFQPLIPGPTVRRENDGFFASFPGEPYEQFECAFAC